MTHQRVCEDDLGLAAAKRPQWVGRQGRHGRVRALTSLPRTPNRSPMDALRNRTRTARARGGGKLDAREN